jgi:hypothetical protein
VADSGGDTLSNQDNHNSRLYHGEKLAIVELSEISSRGGGLTQDRMKGGGDYAHAM